MEFAAKQNTITTAPKKSGSFFGKKSEPPFFTPVLIQPKLTIGPVDDPYEKEADAVADKVMRMSDNETLQTKLSSLNIQRKCAECEEEEKLQMKSEGGINEGLEAPSIVHSVLNSGGQPLDTGTRNFFEPRFGYDFSNVKLHTDSEAAKSAQSINALAYTSGNNIVFNNNQYSPKSENGKRLLGHELTHVVQQNGDLFMNIRKQEIPPDKSDDIDKPPTTSPSVAPPCSQKSKADSYLPTDKDSMGKPLTVSLGSSEFGNTSKLGAFFKFGACKDKTSWNFYIEKLTVSIDSRIQSIEFKIDVPSASDKVVTKESYSAIIKDLKPVRKVKFGVSCGGNSFEDEVTSYSYRKEYWNHQFVVDHEAFHRKDWDEKYRPELVEAEKKVWAHTIPVTEASSASEAVVKANPTLTKFMTDAYQNTCKLFTPKKESRAYDNGASQYQSLVNDIEAKAIKEKW